MARLAVTTPTPQMAGQRSVGAAVPPTILGIRHWKDGVAKRGGGAEAATVAAPKTETKLPRASVTAQAGIGCWAQRTRQQDGVMGVEARRRSRAGIAKGFGTAYAVAANERGRPEMPRRAVREAGHLFIEATFRYYLLLRVAEWD